jgi:hypothetical protein
MEGSTIVTLASIKAIFPIIVLAKVLGLKHGAGKAIVKGLKEVAQEKAKDSIKETIQNKKSDKNKT